MHNHDYIYWAEHHFEFGRDDKMWWCIFLQVEADEEYVLCPNYCPIFFKGHAPTLQEKYDYLLKCLEIQEVDGWEQDALIGMKDRIFFSFSEVPENVRDPVVIDAGIVQAILWDRKYGCV